MFIAGGSIRLFLRATSRCIKLVKRAMGSFACDLHMVSEYLDKQCLPGTFQAISNLNCVATSSVFPFLLFPTCLLFSFKVVYDSLWPHGLHAAHQAPLSSTVSRSLLKSCPLSPLMLSNHLILCCSLTFCPQSLFQWVNSLYQVSKVSELQHWSFW